MKLYFLTLVLDGMPFLPMHLNTFNQLNTKVYDWKWLIAEGQALNVNCTSWCKSMPGRFSDDGTTEFLRSSVWRHPRVGILGRKLWTGGKVQMCNELLAKIDEPGILFQIDVDELWTATQIDNMAALLSGPAYDHAYVFMRYFVGPNIVTQGVDCYGNNPGEWLRVWKFTPGMRFQKHEPPVLAGGYGLVAPMSRGQTAAHSIIPDHWAYVFRKQLEYKEEFYGYADALAHWERLQEHAGPWPVKLKDYLPWVDDRVEGRRLHIPAGA